jgi:mannitol-1-/sugar-/sorbitol-6-phosphatase
MSRSLVPRSLHFGPGPLGPAPEDATCQASASGNYPLIRGIVDGVPSYFAKALLFDLDGTLIDSFVPARRAWQGWAKTVGITQEILQGANHGRQRPEVIAGLLPQAKPETVAKHAETVRIRELNDTEGVVPLKGAFKLLNQLPPDAWAIVTACDRQVAEARLAAAGLPVPKIMVTADDLEKGKPDPQGYLSAARKLRVRPEDAIVFEDALSGIEAARRADMRCIALRTTAASDEMLQDATEIIDDLEGVTTAIYMRGLLIHVRNAKPTAESA